MKLAIATFATQNYLYAFKQVLERIAAAVVDYEPGVFIFATDGSKAGENAAKLIERILPKWDVKVIIHKEIKDDTSENYKVDAQIRIARLQGAAFAEARRQNVDQLLCVESDVLIHPDALKMCQWALAMPGNYYDVAMVTYPNAGFLGGRGTPQNHIAEDFLPSERKLPKRMAAILKECERRLNGEVVPCWTVWKFNDNQCHRFASWLPKDSIICSDPKLRSLVIDRERRRMERLRKRIKECPPDGNVFAVNGKHGWRRRGWFENAYPGIGRGAVVPSDWVGLGCTLLSRRALAVATFEGYTGEGTQDLFLCWHRWYPEGLRMATIPHILCDHVKPVRDTDGKKTDRFEQFVAYHETDGEFAGHLRVQHVPWFDL